MTHYHLCRRKIASVLLASYLMGPALVFAQVVINAGTPNDARRAYVDQTQNGLPKVNIAKPNGAGVSHNVYQEFNVGKQGMILNNGANNTNTSLAGWVEGNPNLTAGNEAKMILNEVVGGKQSQLQGFVEVAGKKADTIIANENGITCQGCGFINTSRVTLSTGAPMWGSAGQLDGLKVRQGAVTIGATGLSAPDSRLDLLSQVINVQGSIHADQINVIAGGNDVRYDDLSLSKQNVIKGSLDIASLGGMYANQIQLVATGKGVGVRVDGTLVSAGNVSITSDGLLTHGGKTSAQNSIQMDAQQITQSGSVLATDKLDVKTQSLTNTGTLVGQDLSLQVDQALVNQGSVGANAALTVTSNSLDNSGKLNAKGSAQITSGGLSNSGEMVSDAALNMTASSFSNTAKIAGSSVTLTSAGALDNGSSADIAAATTLDLKAAAIHNKGTMSANQSMAMEADSLVQSGNLLSKGAFTASKLSTLENSGSLTAQTINVTANKALNLGTGTVASSGQAAIHATTLNNLGRIHTEGQTMLDVRRLNNAGVIQATGRLDIHQAWTLHNAGTLSGANLAVNTQALNNAGRVQADQFTLSAYQDSSIPTADKLAQTTVTNRGVLTANHIAITGYGNVRNANQISTDIATTHNATGTGDIHIQAATLDNTSGSILAKNKLTVAVGDLYNKLATLSSKGDLRITASGSVENGEGLILHQGAGTAQAQAALAIHNAKGQIEGQGHSLSVSAGDIDNSQGQIIQTKPSTGAQPAELNVMVQAGVGQTNTAAATKGQLININGKISSTGNGTVTANSVVTDASSAQLSATSSLTFLDKSKANSGASTSTGGYNWNADIAAANAVMQAQTASDKANADAQTAAANLNTAQDNFIKAQAAKPSTPAALTQAQNAVTAAQTASDAATAAAAAAALQLAAAKAAVPAVNAGTSGTGSAQNSDKPVDITVPNAPVIVLSTASSQIQAGNDLTFNTGTVLFDNHRGSLTAGRNVTVNAQGDVLAGQMTAGNALRVTAKQLEVDQQIRAKTAEVSADKLVVTGRVQGDDSLVVKADSITNRGTLTGKVTQLQGRNSDASLELGNTGMLQGNQSLSIKANKVLNQATFSAGGDIVTQSQYLENQALIFSGGSQKHYGVELVNNGGRIYAVGDITIQGNAAGDNAQSTLNYVGRIEAQGDINLKANTITNRAVVPTVNNRGAVENTVTSTRISSTAKDTFNADGKTAEILAGKNLNIKADELSNEYGIISARLNANIGTRLLTNRAYGAIQTSNYVVKAACFNCHQTVSYSETWGGVIAVGGAATITASEKLDNKTIDTRDGFAGLSADPSAVTVDERSNTASPLTQAFKDRFGIVNGPASSAAGSAPSLNLGSPKALSDGIVLTSNGTFDFSRYTVPNGQTGLFEKAPATSPYLIRGRSDLFAPASQDQYTSYNKFAGSDYLLTRLGLMPSGVKLLGDAWYETQLVQDQMYALKGRTHLVAGTDNDYDLMMGLMDAGLLAQAQFGFGLGESLSAAQQAALSKDMVWPEWQVVDGQKVLVPKLYVAHQDTNNDNNKGARILGTDVAITTRELENTGTLAASNRLAIHAAGKVSGGGSYSGGKTLAIVADTVDLKSASIQSGGWLNIDTANDLALTATQIKAAGDARLTAGGELSLKAQEFNTQVKRGDGSSRTETKYETSNIQAGGTVVLSAKKDLTLEGSKVDAGNNLLVESQQGNVNLVALKETSDYSYNGDGALAEIQAREKAAQEAAPQASTPAAQTTSHTQVHEERLQNVRLTAKANTTVQANQGDIQATALNVTAGQNLTLQAGGVVQLDPLQTNNSQSSAQANGGALKAGNDVAINGGQVSLNRTLAQAGRDISVQATDGGAALKAVDMQAERNFELSSAGNAAIVSEVTTAANGSMSQTTSTIQAGKQANVTALGDLTVQGGDIKGKDVSLIALGDVALTGVQNKAVLGGGSDTTTVTSTQSLKLKGDNVSIQGLGGSSDVTLVAVNVDAANKAKIAGTGDVTIAAAENRTTREWSATNKDCNWWGKCSTTVTHGLEDKTTQVGSDVKGATVDISAGNNLTTVASTIESSGNVSVSAQGKIDYLAALNVDKQEVQSNRSSSWFGIDTSRLSIFGSKSQRTDSSIQTRAATTQLQSEADILSESGGNTRLQGTQVKAQNFKVNASVGAAADPNAKVLIEGVKETLQTSRTQKSESFVWQSMSGNGSTTETLALANIQAKTQFSAPGGIDVQLPPGDPLRGQVQTLSQQPGMAWLNDLSQRKDVNWQEIKLANDQWDYSAQGLTPAGAAILAIVIAVFTAGAAASAAASIATEAGMTAAAGTAGASTAAAAGAGVAGSGVAAGTMLTTTGAALSSAMAAGMTTLASSAGVSFTNNGGDIGKTLKDMGSSQNVKGVLTALVTAGVLTELGSTTTATGQTGANAQVISTTQAVDKFTANLMQNVTNNMASAVVSSAINGKPLNEETLSTALTSALITSGMAQTANDIGAATQNSTLNAYTQAMAHALAGCVGGAAATGNSGGCSAGAVGAVVGELSAKFATDSGMDAGGALKLAITMSAVAGAMVGGPDSAAAVNVASQMGMNAAANNHLYSYKGKIIAIDNNDNNKVIDLSGSDKQKLAAKEPAVLMKEIAGIDADGAPVLVSNQRAKEMTSSTTYDLANAKDRNQLQGQTDMGYINTDDKNTRIYVQTGMQTKPEDALKNAQALSQIVKEPVGVIVNGTQGLPKDVEEYLPKAPSVKDALNEYTYQALNKKGDTLVVLHSAGNEDAKKALQLGQQLGHQYNNLSFLSLASPNSDSVMRSTTTNTNYLGQVNDWRDPVTNPTAWVVGTGAALVGGAAAGIALAPVTGGGSLYGYFTGLIGGGIGGGIGVYGIQNIHPFTNYIAKPQSQSIMFDWLKQNPKSK